MQEQFLLKSKYELSPDQQRAVSNLEKNISEGKNRQVLLGVTGSGKTFVMANVIANTNRPTLVLSHNKTLAAQLYEEFKEFFPENAVKYFVSYYDYYQPEAYIPSRDLYIEKESEVNEEIEKLRLSAMNAARTRRDTIVVASVSCIYNIGSPENYENKSIEIRVGESIEIGGLAQKLTFLRYEREGTDLIPGTFLIRGDSLELYMPYEEFPVKIEFWGNQIERIVYIEPISKQKIGEVDNLDIFPATPLVYDADTMAKAVENIERDLGKRVAFLRNLGKEVEAQRLEQKTRYDMEMMKEIGFCKSMENYSIYFDGRETGQPPYTLLDYFPGDYLLFVDESHITIPQVGGMYNGDRARKTNLIEHGFRLPSAYDNRPLNFNEFRKKQGNTIYFSATPDEWEIIDSNKNVIELLTRPTGLLDPEIDVRKTENQIDDVINEVRKNVENGERVLITTLTKRMSEDLTEYLKEYNIKVAYLHSDIDTVERVEILRNLRLGEYDVLVGINLLREGIDLPEVSLVIILDADKEGFLRSKTSLVQTIGRAARHVNGKVIMYADKVTESMKYALSETNRRREYQRKYNKINNITPTSIQKDIRDRLVEKEDMMKKSLDIEVEKLTEKQKKLMIKDLRAKMLLAAENLQFEKAAEIRDKIKELSI
ncbi:excinuclease ABC subunit B [Candidatus Dojkabacteria bacterium HGW-Dojkabacteria-1]|uniref:UvrABC system protein B n=1 Tax=Candidatus Dojkabacteria bacterium HGW-Dojkabacteria-1 TaxID=2013761 RepID=A0A2N2F4H4_9BACT|nr:MAG: excinuclease ABC subunit B [Candidatus Dojkabacteria bacterium HGW-Dojkabacteria-1]